MAPGQDRPAAPALARSLLGALLGVWPACHRDGTSPPAPSSVRATNVVAAGATVAQPPSGAPVRGAPIRVAIDADPATLNPDLDPDEWEYRLAADSIYEPLWRATADRGFEGVLAERFSIDEGGTRITFHLRHGARFHDGEALRPSDVVFTFEKLRARTTHAPRVQMALADLDRVELAGPDAVRFWLVRPSAMLPQLIAEIGILPEHVFARGDFNYHPANRRPVGTGPLRLRTWERGRRIVLERFPDYWGGATGAEGGVEIEIVPDAVQALGAARRGELDVLGHVPPAWYPEQLDSPTVRSRFHVVRAQPARFTFVVWNLAHPPLDSAPVRRALGLAIDRVHLLGAVRHGLGRAIAAPTLAGASGPAVRYDPLRAAATLGGAGLPRTGEGPRMFRGHPLRLSLLVPSGSKESTEAGRRVDEALGRLGIAVDVAAGDLPIILLRLRTGRFDAALLSWSGRDDDDLAPLFRSGGVQNYGRYSDHDVDVLLDALRRPAPAPDRRALFGRLASALDANPPALFLYAPDEIYLIGRRFGGPPREFPTLHRLLDGDIPAPSIAASSPDGGAR